MAYKFHPERCCGLPDAWWNKPGTNGTCPHEYALVRTNVETGEKDTINISSVGLGLLDVDAREWKRDTKPAPGPAPRRAPEGRVSKSTARRAAPVLDVEEGLCDNCGSAEPHSTCAVSLIYQPEPDA